MNNTISPRVTAWHPAYLESGDSGAIETRIKPCMDPKARYSPLTIGRNIQNILYDMVMKCGYESYVDGMGKCDV